MLKYEYMKKQDMFRIQVVHVRWEEMVGYTAGIVPSGLNWIA